MIKHDKNIKKCLEMTKCKNCYHDCHCDGDLHSDEYGICVCEDCQCEKEKDFGDLKRKTGTTQQKNTIPIIWRVVIHKGEKEGRARTATFSPPAAISHQYSHLFVLLLA